MSRNGLAITRGMTHVVGYPGTDPVEVSSPGLPVASFDKKTAPSNTAPDLIDPDLYVAGTANMGPWARLGALATRYGDNELPKPAGQWGYIPTPAIPRSRAAKFGGRKVVPQPRVVQRWPSIFGGS
jgi:hypothetical protein